MDLVYSKILVPYRRKDILRRQRLVDKLHQNIDRKLIFISAPLGFGKTTLLIDFANDIDAHVCWYKIERDDIDLLPFTTYLVASIQQQFPEFGRELFDSLQNGEVRQDPVGLGIEISNEMVRHVTDFCVLCLDDFHLVGEQQPIVDLFETLFTYLPDQVRLVIASRSVFGVPTTHLLSSNDLATLGAIDLRFLPEELKQLTQIQPITQVSAYELDELASRSDGWILSFLLSLRALEQGGQPGGLLPPEELVDYLVNEVVDLLPSHLRDFLLRTSILDDLNPALCNEILGIDNSLNIITELENRNLFLNRVISDQTSPVFRYHQLFKEILAAQFASREPEIFTAQHNRAAEWYIQQDEWEKAIYHKIEAGEHQQAAHWMNQFVSEMFIRGRTTVIEDWISQIESPIDLRRDAPVLCLYWAKVLYERAKYDLGDQYIELAVTVFRQKKDIKYLVNAYVTQGMGKVYRGNPQEGFKLAQEALDLASGEDQIEYYICQAWRLAGLALRHLGQKSESVRYLKAAVEGLKTLVGNQAFHQGWVIHDLAESLNDLGIACFDNGDVLEAQRQLEDLIEVRRQQKSNLGGLTLALNNVGYMYYLLGRFEEAWEKYEEAYQIGKTIKNHRGLVHLLNSRGDLLRDLSEWQAARQAYLEAKDRASGSDLTALITTHLGLAELERRTGNLQEALYWLREAARLGNQTAGSPDYLVGLGQIYLDMGQVKLAVEALSQAITIMDKRGNPSQTRALAHYLLTITSANPENGTDHREHLRIALELAARLGYDQFLVIPTREKLDQLEKFAQEINHPQLNRLIRRAKEFPAFEKLQKPALPVVKQEILKLEVRGFGHGLVYRNGELITPSDWRSINARSLFFYLLESGKFEKEKISLEFWPDFSTARSTSNFQTTLWRMRRALGSKEVILYEDEVYRLNSSVALTYDVYDFRAYLEKTRQASTRPHLRKQLLKKAITLYQREFLLDLEGQWVEDRRRELEQIYLQALEDLGDLLAEEGDAISAIQWLEKSVDVDPYRDRVRLKILQNLVNSGNSAAAKRYFAEYQEFLWNELRTKPHPDLIDFIDKID
jgi:ATP/maltotriose-dependent transcriptional regulator MalT/DNA-binding SARP family transcriptional activator